MKINSQETKRKVMKKILIDFLMFSMKFLNSFAGKIETEEEYSELHKEVEEYSWIMLTISFFIVIYMWMSILLILGVLMFLLKTMFQLLFLTYGLTPMRFLILYLMKQWIEHLAKHI